jgi:hypothetical protein
LDRSGSNRNQGLKNRVWVIREEGWTPSKGKAWPLAPAHRSPEALDPDYHRPSPF